MSAVQQRRRQPGEPPPPAAPATGGAFEGLNIDASHVQAALDYLTKTAALVEEAKAAEGLFKDNMEEALDNAFALSTAKGVDARKVAVSFKVEGGRRNPRYLHWKAKARAQQAILAGFHARRSAAEHLISAWQTAQRTGNGARL